MAHRLRFILRVAPQNDEVTQVAAVAGLFRSSLLFHFHKKESRGSREVTSAAQFPAATFIVKL
jgi:hypothetical protein